MFILTDSGLTTPSFPWFMDLIFQVPIQYYSLQHQVLLSLPDPFTTECCIRFGPTISFILGLLVILCSSPVAYWTPSNLGDSSSGIILVCPLYSSWSSYGKYTGVACHSLLQWITFGRTLCYDSSILGGPSRHASQFHWATQALHYNKAVILEGEMYILYITQYVNIY